MKKFYKWIMNHWSKNIWESRITILKRFRFHPRLISFSVDSPSLLPDLLFYFVHVGINSSGDTNKVKRTEEIGIVQTSLHAH